jgi:hypothetical protein
LNQKRLVRIENLGEIGKKKRRMWGNFLKKEKAYVGNNK